MANALTEIVFILDRSGSMGGLESDAIGGFNGMLAKQRQKEGQALVSTILFDDCSQVIHDRVPLCDVPPLTGEQYYVRGCTALLDALGDAIRHIALVHKYARPEDVPQSTLFVITTDGMENASKRYGSQEIKQMVTRQKLRGWEFIFLGANIDAVETARRYGINRERAVTYVADRQGTGKIYPAMGRAIDAIREGKPVPDEWLEHVAQDYKKRGG